MTVSSAAWNGLGYSVSGITFPVTIAAGQSVSFKVTFAPQSGGSSPGGISFISTASNSPTAATFSGNGIHNVTLAWAASTSTVVGYNVYRGTISGGPYTKITASPVASTGYLDATVTAGTTYFYVVTAVDSTGQESVFSNESAAAVPTP